MKFDKVLKEDCTTSADIVGTNTPWLIDWASAGGPQTDLGKRAMKKKKKIVRRKINTKVTKI